MCGEGDGRRRPCCGGSCLSPGRNFSWGNFRVAVCSAPYLAVPLRKDTHFLGIKSLFCIAANAKAKYQVYTWTPFLVGYYVLHAAGVGPHTVLSFLLFNISSVANFRGKKSKSEQEVRQGLVQPLDPTAAALILLNPEMGEGGDIPFALWFPISTLKYREGQLFWDSRLGAIQ